MRTSITRRHHLVARQVEPPNLKFLDPQLMSLVVGADPGNKYAAPCAWGTMVLGQNVTKAKQIVGPNIALDDWESYRKG